MTCKKSNGRPKGVARYWSTLQDRRKVSCSFCAKGYTYVGKKKDIIKEMKSVKFCH